jgi:putative ABC transport system permease protein
MEGGAIARSQLVATAVTALVVAAVCAVILATVGQSAATVAKELGRIDEAGTRTIVVRDATGDAGLRADSVDALLSVHGVVWALGLGQATDVRNADLGPAGQPVPARRFYGDLPSEIQVSGRLPHDGEALIGSQAIGALGVATPAVGLVGPATDVAAVGGFDAQAPLAFLSRSVLIARPAPKAASLDRLRELYLVVDTVEAVDPVAATIRLAVHADAPQRLAIETPSLLVELRAAVGGELAGSSRQLLLIVLGVGLLLVAATTAGAVSARRRDFGRRRALGATRSVIVLLVLVQIGVAAFIGSLAGTAVGLVAVVRLAGSSPDPPFVLGVSLLALLMALIAGVPPALLAAFRDPVRILRVP